jgi:phospholipase/lecithinase/hemolysin
MHRQALIARALAPGDPMQNNMQRIIAAVACSFALLGSTAAAGYAQLTVFGDSLSDGGNDFLFSGGAFPPPPYLQRFTNGPTAVEVMAANLGLPLTPSLLGGRNYAYGGAGTGVGNYLAVGGRAFRRQSRRSSADRRPFRRPGHWPRSSLSAAPSPRRV